MLTKFSQSDHLFSNLVPLPLLAKSEIEYPKYNQERYWNALYAFFFIWEKYISYIFCKSFLKKNHDYQKRMNKKTKCTKKLDNGRGQWPLTFFYINFGINDRSETLPNLLICVTPPSLELVFYLKYRINKSFPEKKV